MTDVARPFSLPSARANWWYNGNFIPFIDHDTLFMSGSLAIFLKVDIIQIDRNSSARQHGRFHARILRLNHTEEVCDGQWSGEIV